MDAHRLCIALTLITASLAWGCNEGQATLGATDAVEDGTTTGGDGFNLGQEWLTINTIDPADLAVVQVQREAISLGLYLGKGALTDEVNLVLEDIGIPSRYTASTQSGTDYVPVAIGGSCPFPEPVGTPSGSVDCRTVSDRATVAAYARITSLKDNNPLDSGFDNNRSENELWYGNGIETGVNNEALVAMRVIRQNGLCDQDIEPRESAFEAGVEAGRDLYIEKLNDRLAEVGIDINYPDDNRQIDVCAADQALLIPAKSNAQAATDLYAADNPLCANYTPQTIDEIAARDDADVQYLEGLRRGIDTEHSLAEEKIFRVVPCNVSDPLVFDVEGDGIRLVSLGESRADFDLFGVGETQRSTWIQGDDALLALDRDGNGQIDSGRELFGNFVGAVGYHEVKTGFEHLALLDADQNGLIDQNDAAYTQLQLWQDVDGDGQSQDSELHSLRTLGVASIALGYRAIPESAGLDRQLTQRGLFVRTAESALKTGTAVGSVYDVWFRYVQTPIAD